MKTKGNTLLVGFLLIVLMSSCAAPVVVSTSIPINTPTPTSTFTLMPSLTSTPTMILTPKPVLYCADKIPGCYFLGSEIARIFARMTLPCYENGGVCFPPIADCTTLPPSVVHVPIEDLATAWEAEINGNLAYKDLLNPKLYDTEKSYCFVDEGIAQSVRDAGNAGYSAYKSCLDNEAVPCDVYLQFIKINPITCGGDCQGWRPGAYLTETNFAVIAMWVTPPLPEMDLKRVLRGELVDPKWFNFAYVFLSSAVGFNNDKPPVDIFIAEK